MSKRQTIIGLVNLAKNNGKTFPEKFFEHKIYPCFLSFIRDCYGTFGVELICKYGSWEEFCERAMRFNPYEKVGLK